MAVAMAAAGNVSNSAASGTSRVSGANSVGGTLSASATMNANATNASSNVEFVACILATTVGTARLYPIAVPVHMPKHMLPVAGIPLLFRLLASLEAIGFLEAVVVVHPDDAVTRAALVGTVKSVSPPLHPYKAVETTPTATATATSSAVDDCLDKSSPRVVVLQSKKMKVTLLTMPIASEETADAVRHVEDSGVVPASSHLFVVPGDLLILDAAASNAAAAAATATATGQAALMRDMIHQHRLNQNGTTRPGLGKDFAALDHFTVATTRSSSASVACSVLLTDVGAVDEKGQPLKESAKQKKGLLSRDEEEVDYIAINGDGRLVWKQPKLDVEDDKDMVGSTPKLVLPKARLRSVGVGGDATGTRIRTEWNDVHCYCLSPWVRRLLVVKSAKSLQSLRYDLIPLLIARQFRGAVATFGASVDRDVVHDVLVQTFPGRALSPNEPFGLASGTGQPSSAAPMSPSAATSDGANDSARAHTQHQQHRLEYRVQAHVATAAAADSRVIRVNSVATYLYANREFIHALATTASAPGSGGATTVAKIPTKSKGGGSHSSMSLPDGASLNTKFHSIVLAHCKVADKVTFKSSVVGSGCTLGVNCRLNNVVLHDNVTVGDNAILQNTIVGSNSTIGENCNLNDCQVGADKTIAAGTKAKGEAFASDSL